MEREVDRGIHRQEGSEAEGDYPAWRGAQVKPLGKEKKNSTFPNFPFLLNKLNPSSRHFGECLGMGIAWRCAALVSVSQGS